MTTTRKSLHMASHSTLMQQFNKKQSTYSLDRPLNPLKFEAKMPLAMRRLAQLPR